MTHPISHEERREKYDGILKLPADKKAAGLALNRAHDLRRFEIENYWRRSTYFWGFQLAALAALAVARQGSQIDPHVLAVVAILGMTTGYTGYLTARGSKFWQRNWEAHVDLLEDVVEGRLHKTVFIRSDGRAPSVSKASERLWQVLTAGWVIAFAVGVLFIATPDPKAAIDQVKVVHILFLVEGAVFAMAWMHATRLSDLDDRSYDHDTLKKISR